MTLHKLLLIAILALSGCRTADSGATVKGDETPVTIEDHWLCNDPRNLSSDKIAARKARVLERLGEGDYVWTGQEVFDHAVLWDVIFRPADCGVHLSLDRATNTVHAREFNRRPGETGCVDTYEFVCTDDLACVARKEVPNEVWPSNESPTGVVTVRRNLCVVDSGKVVISGATAQRNGPYNRLIYGTTR